MRKTNGVKRAEPHAAKKLAPPQENSERKKKATLGQKSRAKGQKKLEWPYVT